MVGVPGRIVRQNTERVDDLNQTKLPDPILEEFKRINDRMAKLEEKLDVHSCKYSITMNDDALLAEEFKQPKGEEDNA